MGERCQTDTATHPFMGIACRRRGEIEGPAVLTVISDRECANAENPSCELRCANRGKCGRESVAGSGAMFQVPTSQKSSCPAVQEEIGRAKLQGLRGAARRVFVAE